MNLITAFIFRDLSIEKTYKFNFFMKIASIFFQLSIFYFLSRYFLKQEYFSFIFVGLLFSRFFQFWLNVFTENIKQEQYWGTAELIFLAPKKPLYILFSSINSKFLILVLELIIYVLLGKFIFAVNFHFNFIFFIYFFLNALAFCGLGLTAGSFILFFKRGDPVNWFIAGSFDILSGVYFPISVLPKSLLKISKILPTTSALSIWREIILNNKNILDFQYILIHIIWALVLFVIGILCFKTAFYFSRKKGELGNY